MPPRSASNPKHAVFSVIARAQRALRGARVQSSGLREVRNFLFLQYEAPLGSVVHATPLLESLKAAVLDAHITVAASRMAASVLGNSPFVDRCMVAADPFANLIAASRDIRRLLLSMPPGPRCIVTTIGNQRTRLALFSLLAGNALRAGYTLAPELYDIPLKFVPENGQIEGNLDILRALGHEAAFYEPRIFFTHADADVASRWLETGEAQYATRIAVVTQNSGGQRNQWKAERFQQVIGALSRSHGMVPVFFGTSADAPAIESLRKPLPNPGISLAGRTTVPQLAAALAQCDLAVSLDTGTFHVARGVGLPGVVIAPAWQDPREWLPVDHPRYRVLRGQSLATAPTGYCIEEISAELVIAAATDLLKQFPASPDCRAQRLQNSLSHRL